MSFFLFRSMCNKTIIRFGFCDIQNNQGLGKGYQPKSKAIIIRFDVFVNVLPTSIYIVKLGTMSTFSTSSRTTDYRILHYRTQTLVFFHSFS